MNRYDVYWQEWGGEVYKALRTLASSEDIPFEVCWVYMDLWENLEHAYKAELIPYLPTIPDLENSILKLREARDLALSQTSKWNFNGIVSKGMDESLYLLYEGEALITVKDLVQKTIHQSKHTP